MSPLSPYNIARNIPLALGDGFKIITPNEYETLNAQRKSLYAKINIKKGEIITTKKISIKGPGGGLLPRYLNIVLGRKALEDMQTKSDCLKKNMLTK